MTTMYRRIVRHQRQDRFDIARLIAEALVVALALLCGAAFAFVFWWSTLCAAC